MNAIAFPGRFTQSYRLSAAGELHLQVWIKLSPVRSLPCWHVFTNSERYKIRFLSLGIFFENACFVVWMGKVNEEIKTAF